MKKIETIADIKMDINIENVNLFEDFIYQIRNDKITDEHINQELIDNFHQKIKNGIYEFIIHIFNNKNYTKKQNKKFSNKKDQKLFDENYFTESFKFISKNLTLENFLFSVCKEASWRLEKYSDFHIFLEGFKKINDNKYEIMLGS